MNPSDPTGTLPGDGWSEAACWKTLVRELREFAGQYGFQKALLGLSGGMDSALVAVIAAHAFGPDHVLGVFMPSPHTSQASQTDAMALADNLGMPTVILPIDELMRAFDQTLNNVFTGSPADVTEENIQARIRGTLLMALSNKWGGMVLATGNKSELGLGYCTLYGDMVGALAVIGDLTKTRVYALARWVNQNKGEPIPESMFSKPPSAELKPGQTDQDTLPPYADLDPLLECWLDGKPNQETLCREGFDPELVSRVLSLAQKNCFKLLQAPPVIKLTSTPLGKSWR